MSVITEGAPTAPGTPSDEVGLGTDALARRRRRAPWWTALEPLDRWVGLFVLAACVAFVFVELRPDLIFLDTTAAGGDTAAHVWWPAYLRDHLLPFRLAGWSPDFYAGFPAGQFYFPVPALLIVALDVVLPYNIAFKLGTIAGALLLPVGAYVFARGIRAPRPTPALFAVAATAFLFFTGNPGTGTAAESIAFNQHIAGGSLPSALAGEYSYTLALAFALLFFGTFASALRNGRRMWLPAVMLAAAVMSHLVVGIFAAVGALVIVLASLHPPDAGARPRIGAWSRTRRVSIALPAGAAALVVLGLAIAAWASAPVGATLILLGFGVVAAWWAPTTVVRAVAIGGVGTLLTAVWFVPLVSVLGYTTDMRYTPITEYGDYLFPDYMFGLQSLWPWEWGAAVLIGIALIGGIVGRRPSTFVVIAITALSGLIFRFWEDIQATPAWNLRFLPFWYIGIFLLMGLGGAELVRGVAWTARRGASDWATRIPPRVVGAAIAATLTILLSVGTLVALDGSKGFIPYWARWNYRGYEDTTGEGTTPAKQFDEYRSFIDAMDALAPGRVLWEGNTQLNVYGSPLAMMLLPYWTDGKISSMEGVYYEASATSPYHFMATAALDAPGNSSGAVRGIEYRTQEDFDLGVRWLQTLGIRYLAVHSDQAKQRAGGDPRLELVTTSPNLDDAAPTGWSVYEVKDSALVAPLHYRPVVVDGFDAHDQDVCRRRLTETGLDAKSLHLHEWQDCVGVPWFDDPEALDRPLVADGPESWQRAGTSSARGLEKEPLPPVRVTDVQSRDDEISFHVSRTGVPVMVKASWFPNWKAEGAEGPFRATPNYMVVVPTEKDVTLTYGTTNAEWLGRVSTLAGVAGVGLLAWWPSHRRRRSASADPAPTADGGGEPRT
ncbi:MAG: hypothetical protein WEC34_14660 [Acidimicrobiia bacterium]